MTWFQWLMSGVAVIAAALFIRGLFEEEVYMSDEWRDRQEHGKDQR